MSKDISGIEPIDASTLIPDWEEIQPIKASSLKRDGGEDIAPISADSLVPDAPPMPALPSHKTMAQQSPVERIAATGTPLEKTVEFIKSQAKTVPATALAQYQKGMAGKWQQAGEALGLDGVAEAGKASAEEAQTVLEQISKEYPADPNSWEATTRSALSSIYQQVPLMLLARKATAGMAPAAAASAATALSLIPMGAVSGGAEYYDLRKKGLSPFQAGMGALGTEVVEVGTEIWPMHKVFELAGAAGKMAIGAMWKKLGQYGAGEFGGETAATFLQTIIDKLYSREAIKPGMTPKEAGKVISDYVTTGEAWQDFKNTVKSTAIQTGTMMAGGAGINRVSGQQEAPAPVKIAGPLEAAIAKAGVTPETPIATPPAPVGMAPAEAPAAPAPAAEPAAAADTGIPVTENAPADVVIEPAPVKTSTEDITAWAKDQIRAGNTQLMRQVKEPLDAYLNRLTNSRKIAEGGAPPIAADSGGGMAPPRAPVTTPKAVDHDAETMASITEADKENLKSARDLADYWERGSMQNGRSNKTELFPWLNNWGDTTPAEVGKAIDNFLGGKKLGTVQARLVAETIRGERERQQQAADTSFDFSPETDTAAHQAATSPLNGLPEPTQPQIEAGNYQKGHLKIHGLDISIENPKGSMRRGVDETGRAWEMQLANHYGYIRGTIGRDKDHIDAFIGGDPESDKVYIVDQRNMKNGKFDEHKVMLGFNDPKMARDAYIANYDKHGIERIGAFTELSVPDFKLWIDRGTHTWPYSQTFEKGKPNADLQKLHEEGSQGQAQVSDVRGADQTTEETGGMASGTGEGETTELSQDFGPVFREFRHDDKGAIAKLREMQNGEAIAALHHSEVGDIDLVWGNEGTSAKDYEDGFGLAKIIKKHPEVVDDLQGILDTLHRDKEKSRKGYAVLESEDHEAVVRLDWDRKAKTWLLTEFKKTEETGTEKRAGIPSITEEDSPLHQSLPDSIIPSTPANVKPSSAGKTPSQNPAEKAKGGPVRDQPDLEVKAPENASTAAEENTNKIFTKERADRAREILREKLKQLNAGLDPEMIQAGIDLAGYHIERGARKFAEYSRAMIEDLGEAIRPFLKSFYMAVRNYPGIDNHGMDREENIDTQLAVAKVEEANAVPLITKHGNRKLRGDYGVETINAYTAVGEAAKKAFLIDAQGFLKEVGKVLADNAWTPEKVSVNRAGVAGSGDVHLIAFKEGQENGAYVTIGGDVGGMGLAPNASPSGVRIMYRANTRKDKYSGGVNRWDAPWDISSGDLAGKLVEAAGAKMPFGPFVAPAQEQGALFTNPPTFGKKPQGTGNATLEDLPLYTEPKEREAEADQQTLPIAETAPVARKLEIGDIVDVRLGSGWPESYGGRIQHIKEGSIGEQRIKTVNSGNMYMADHELKRRDPSKTPVMGDYVRFTHLRHTVWGQIVEYSDDPLMARVRILEDEGHNIGRGQIVGERIDILTKVENPETNMPAGSRPPPKHPIPSNEEPKQEVAPANGLRVEFNADHNGIELHFPAKPDAETIQRIKAMGFRWSVKNKLWYAKDTSIRRQQVELLQRDMGNVPAPATPAQVPLDPAALAKAKWDALTRAGKDQVIAATGRGMGITYKAWHYYTPMEQHEILFQLDKLFPAILGEEPATPPAPAEPAGPYIMDAQQSPGPRNIARLLKGLGIDKSIFEGEDYHARFYNDPYIPLVIERHDIGSIPHLYFTHYIEMNGDLVLDSEMVWKVNRGVLVLEETAVPNPVTGGEYRRTGVRADAHYAAMFAKNLIDQGFAKASTETAKPEAVAEPEARHDATTQIAEYVLTKLKNKERITFLALAREGERAYGSKLSEGKYDAKDLTDAMELGVNLRIRESELTLNTHDTLEQARKVVADIEAMQELLPTQTRRTAEMEEFQQFSTPPAYGYMAAWVANLKNIDTVLEPSAGVGGLAVFARNAGARVYVNELSKRRLDLLKRISYDKIYNENAEQLHNILPSDVQPSVVLMNPPFTSTAGRMQGERKSANGGAHIEQALKRLQPGGRLVAIVGEGMAADRPAFRDWWKKISAEYNVRANVGTNGIGFRKYGTTFDNQILVIDKTGKTERPPITGKVETVTELLPLLEGVRNDRTDGITSVNIPHDATGSKRDQQGQPDTNQQAGGETTQAGEPGDRSGTVAPGTVSGVRTGQRDQAGTSEWDNGLFGQKPDGSPVTGEGAGSVHPAAAQPSAQSPHGSAATSGKSDHVDGGKQSALAEPEGLKVEEKDVEAETGAITDSVYEPYKPQRLSIPGARPHPGNLVQSAAMASVEPPAPTYTPALPQSTITQGKLSIAQMEPVVYAGQAHTQILPNGFRRGFFVGDGTGVGKGRILSGIILDNFAQGRKKAIWFSERASLILDAKAHFEATGGNPRQIFDLSKTKIGQKVGNTDGVMFATYSTLKSGLDQAGTTITSKEKGSRLDQIVEWLGADFDGVIGFDESHNMQNAVPSRGARGIKKASLVGLSGLDLQKRLPMARIVYMSATGATEVANFAYADRLGLWGDGTPFADKNAFISQVQAGGVAAMELVARDMKALGVYIARSLSYDDVEYSRLEHILTPEQEDLYNEMARGWQTVLQNINTALEASSGDLDPRAKSAAYSAFWGAELRFFNQIITSMQMPTILADVQKQIDDGKAAILQLVNTNEAVQNRQLANMEEEQSLDELDMTPRENLMQYLENSFPTQQYEEYTDPDGNVRSRPVVDANGNPVQNADAVAMKNDLLNRLGSLKVPEGPIEMLLNHFGADTVAEVTGRTQRIVYQMKDGVREKVVGKRTRASHEADADAFMDDKKQILIFSDAGGTGRSYHSDLTRKNQRQRVHYLVQPGWRADKAVQGLGRSHRTNQASAPIDKLCTTNLKGQRRFMSSIARRLDQLGALTKGERRSGGQGLFNANDNLESDYAKNALIRLLRESFNGNSGLDFADIFMGKMGLRGLIDERDGTLNDSRLPPIPQFLNRVLTLEIHDQNVVFQEFEDRLIQNVERAIANGTYETGLENYHADKIRFISDQTVYTEPNSGAETKYVKLEASHRVIKRDFDEARQVLQFIGFFRNIISGKVWAAKDFGTSTNADGSITEDVKMQGQTTRQVQIIKKSVLDLTGTLAKWTRLTNKEAQPLWDEQQSAAKDFHDEKLHMISGTVLPIWDRLPTGHRAARVLRLQTDDGHRYLGRMIHNDAINDVLTNLGATPNSEHYDPAEILDRLQNGALATLANGWQIRRAMVAGSWRLELLGDNLYPHLSELQRHGAFTEIHNYRTRYFVPQTEETIAGLVASRPVVTITGGTSSYALADHIVTEEGRRMPINRGSLDRIMEAIGNVLPSGSTTLNVTDRITHNDPKAFAAHGVDSAEIAGMTQQARRISSKEIHALITLSMGAATEETGYHEVFHAAKMLGILNEQDQAILDRAYPTKGGIDGEERAAEAFGLYGLGRQRPIISIRMIWDKLLKWLEGITHALKGLGYRTANDVFSDLWGGKLKDQAARSAWEQHGTRFMTAWHGSPHDFEAFDSAHIGKGEGNQAYGHGLYFASSKAVAEYYKDALSGRDLNRTPLTETDMETISQDPDWPSDVPGHALEYLFRQDRFDWTEQDFLEQEVKQPDWTDVIDLINGYGGDGAAYAKSLQERYYLDTEPVFGKLYQVELAPKEDEYLLWDKPLSEQSEKVKEAIKNGFDEIVNRESDYHKASALSRKYQNYNSNHTGENVYGDIAYELTPFGSERNEQAASDYLHSLGIRGIKYLDGSSRNKGDGNYNYVIFSDADISIQAKYSLKDQGTGGITPAGMLKSLAGFLNPLDYSRFRKFAEREMPEDAKRWISDNLQTPFWKQTANPGARPFYEEAKDRDIKRFDNNIRMFGGLLDREGRKTAMGKIKDFMAWSDHQTVWGKKVTDAEFTKDEINQFSTIAFESDAMGSEYSQLNHALMNPRIKAAGLTQKVFDFYRSFLDAKEKAARERIAIAVEGMLEAGFSPEKIAAVVAQYDVSLDEIHGHELRLELEGILADMAEQGATPEMIARHISDYRGILRDRLGWIHRDHGDGQNTVGVYHNITELKFQIDQVQMETKASREARKKNPGRARETESAGRFRLPYYPGLAVKRQMQEIVRKLGGTFHMTHNGRIIMLFSEAKSAEAWDRLTAIPTEGARVLVYKHYLPSQAQAQRLAKSVKADLSKAMPANYIEGEDYEVVTGFADKVHEEMYQSTPTGDMAIEAIMKDASRRAQNRGELTPEERKTIDAQLVQSIAETMMGRGAEQYQIRRVEYLIEGYDRTDALGKFNEYVNGVAGMLSKARYAMRQFKNLDAANPHIKQWAFRYVADSLRNMGIADRMGGNVRAAVSLWYLGMNFSWMLINSTQPYVFGGAILSEKLGDTKLKEVETNAGTMLVSKKQRHVYARIAKSEADVIRGNLSAEEKALLQSEEVLTQQRESFQAELTGNLEGTTGMFSKGLHATTRASMALGQKVEVLNRRTMLVAAYRVFREQGKSDTMARQMALEVNSAVNIDMGRFNLPGWARGVVGRNFYALQSYIQHALNFMYYRATSGEVKDQKAILRLLWVMFLIGGANAGAPGSDELDKLILRLFGYSPKLALRGFTRRMAKDYGTPGEMLDGFIWHGVPGAFKPFGFGVSLTGAIQFRLPVISNLIAGDELSRSITGPLGGLVQKGAMAGRQAVRGDWARAAEYLLPTSLANILSGQRQVNTGVKTSHGKRVYYRGRPLKMTPMEGALRTIGVQPSRPADIQETRGTEMKLRAEWNGRRMTALDNWRNGRKLRYISDFNRALRDSQAADLVPRIDPETMEKAREAAADKKATRFERKYGLD